jgi:methionyl-tRNA synthetase
MFVEKFFNSTVPKITMNGDDEELLKNINEELKGYNENLEKSRLRDGLRNILSISRHGNQYMQVNQPWVLIKGSEADK